MPLAARVYAQSGVGDRARSRPARTYLPASTRWLPVPEAAVTATKAAESVATTKATESMATAKGPVPAAEGPTAERPPPVPATEAATARGPTVVNAEPGLGLPHPRWDNRHARYGNQHGRRNHRNRNRRRGERSYGRRDQGMGRRHRRRQLEFGLRDRRLR